MSHDTTAEGMSKIRRMLKAHEAIETTLATYTCLPEKAVKDLVSAANAIGEAIIEANAETANDVADKFRLLAALIDDPAGQSWLVDEAAANAIASLQSFNVSEREALNRVYDEFFGRPAPVLEAAE